MNHFAAVCRNGNGDGHGKPENSDIKTIEVINGKLSATEVTQPKLQTVAEITNDCEFILDAWCVEIVSAQDVHMISVEQTKVQKVIESGESLRPRKEYTEVLRLGGIHYVRFKLDPGSEANILPTTVFSLLNKQGKIKVIPTSIKLRAYGNVLSAAVGKIIIPVETKFGSKIEQCEFLLSNVADRPILGIEACELLDLVKRVEHPTNVNSVEFTTATLPESKEDFIEKYKEVFTGLGEFKQKVDPNVQPGGCPSRRYNYSVRTRLKGKLDALESRGIIAKVTGEMPKFVSNLVIREKSDGDLRLCLDPAILNKAIIRQKYTIPLVDELACQITGKKIFSVLDLKEGFWHATLDDESSLLCSFSSPYGIYRFKKMPFGISCAPEIFQYLVDQVFKGTGAILYFDDCLIAGKDYEEHDAIMKTVMLTSKTEPVKFNPGKLQYRTTQVKFLGHLWSYNQIKVDPERVRAITAIKEPKTKKQLQKALQTFNFLRKFIPQMGEIGAPLYALLSEKVQFQWLAVHAMAFKTLKDAICTAPVLATFDPKKPLVVQADASQSGLGATLLQVGQPIAFASRILTDSERDYAQIEKEMLALVFAAYKFETYIYGMPEVTFQTDHKPLVSVCTKPMHKITNNRLKKLRLKLMKFDPKVVYLPGKYMYIADILSRQSLDDPVEDDPEMIEIVHEVTKHLSIAPQIQADLRKETLTDVGLSAVISYYKKGWPNDRNMVLPAARSYWQIRNDLFLEDGLVILEDRVVVPVSLRAKVLKSLHTAHLGIEKTKARARQTVYWPGLTNDIVQLVSECRTCERHSANNFKEPLIPHKIPELRFQKVSVDILDLEGNSYLVLEDNLSKWLEIKQLSNKSAQTVIKVLKSIFYTHGIPEIIYGDNNPLNSYACHEFATQIGSKIETSSPEYSRSNGLAEKGVHIAKRLLKKCKDTKMDFLDALREYNNTPLTGLDVSPSQILMSRLCRTTVPVLQKRLQPKVFNVRPMLKRLQAKMKAQHDQHARRKPVKFQQGDKVVVRRGEQWHKGVIEAKHSAPRSYIVRQLGGSGRSLRRNTYHLKHSYTAPDGHDEHVRPYDIDGQLAPAEIVYDEIKQHVNPVPEAEPVGPALNPVVLLSRLNVSPGARVDQTGKVTRLGRVIKMPKKFE